MSTCVTGAVAVGVVLAAFVVWIVVMNRIDGRREQREREAAHRSYWELP